MHKIGYARVSTSGQNLESQLDALKEAGCSRIFTDKVSGAKEERPGWQEMMEYVRQGDTLVIAELSRMSRSLSHLLKVVQELEEKGVQIQSLREQINTTTATGRAFLSIMGAINQMERELRAERAAAGRQAARARGRSGGRPQIDPKKLQQAKTLFENGHTAEEACKAVGIGRRTLFKYLAEE
jgi:DNA invertase Pin-like site-specific DNA recombinase